MSTGPLNLNWLNGAIKSLTRSAEPAARTSAGTQPESPSMAGDSASVRAGQQRYMGWADQVPAEEKPTEAAAPEMTATEPAAEAQDAPAAPPLDVEWVTNSPASGQVPASAGSASAGGLDMEWVTNRPASGQVPASASNASAGGLDMEWQTGASASQSLGGTRGNAGASSSGSLGLEWRSGNTSSGQGGIQAGGGRPSTSAGLGMEWQRGTSSSGLGASGGGGGRSGGLDVNWAGGSGGSIGGGGSGAIAPPRPDPNSAVRPNPAPETAVKPAPVTDAPTTPPLDASRLAEIRSQLTGALPAIPERPLSDNWQQSDLRNRAALIKAMRGDVALQAAFADWDNLPADLRLEAGKRIAAMEGAIYGFEPAPIQVDSSLRKPSYGFYHPGEDKVHVSPDTLANLKEFVNTVTHEQAHAYQWEKGTDAKKGRMSPSDPLYATAVSWHDNFFNYSEPSYGYQAYRTQPIEAHAFSTGDGVVAGVFG